jgi:hypothetical protein
MKDGTETRCEGRKEKSHVGKKGKFEGSVGRMWRELGVVMVRALRYKPEGRGFETR